MSASDDREFLLPSPTEQFLLVAAVWAVLCVVLLLFSERVYFTLMRISSTVAQLLAGGDLASYLPIILVVGVLGVAVFFAAFARSEKGFIVALLLSFSFADSTWSAGHYAAFLVKYMATIYLAAFGVFFVFRNWNRISSPV